MTQEKNIGNKCIFCEIIAGREAASKIYEDEKVLAFMNIRPVNTGEFMVIPKQHIDHFLDIPDDLAAHILLTAQRLARKVQKKFKPKRMGYVVHGFGVPHAHLNVVPLEHPDDIVSYKLARIVKNQVIFDPKQIPLISREELDRIAKTIKEAED
jgi:histidine triad (HIT) family protein